MADHPDKSAPRPSDETIKETFESIVIAFILAFVFRAYVVEAFIIPTGSMAPTLLGAHVHVRCNQCGYEFDFDPPEKAVGRGHIIWPNRSHDTALGALCPMCLAPNVVKGGTPLNAGDRILVHKYIYSFSEPRRWDVVVFKAPHDPETNYIKRLVGLPREQLYLFEGNVYVRPAGAEPPAVAEGAADGWRIARKTSRADVQRAVWQPIYISDYIPRDGGDRSYDSRYDWSVPWVAAGPTADQWQIEGRRSYHYAGADPGRLTFRFRNSSAHNAALIYPYNQLKGHGGLEPIEDIRIAARVEPLQNPVGVTFSTTARLDNADLDFGRERLTATITPSGEVSLEARALKGDAVRILEHRRVDPLPVGRATLVEFWYADQEASLWIDGERTVVWRYNLPLETLVGRGRPAARPDVTVEIVGGPVDLHDVRLDRDLYYSDHLGANEALGAWRSNGKGDPLTIGPDEFFCLGDNSPQSSDGRFWGEPNAWIRQRMLQDRVDAGLDPAGIVPRDLMMGRAFFVYFPAPYVFARLPLPNFGDMRFIR